MRRTANVFRCSFAGRTLKTITDSTGASVQVPRDDESNASAATAPETTDDSEDGPLISISLSGPQTAVDSARAQILALVRERMSKTSTRLPDIPSEFWALLGARAGQVVERAGVDADEVRVDVPRRWTGKRGVDVVNESGEEADRAEDKREKEKAITVSGDKDAVKKVVAELEAELAELVGRFALSPSFPGPR